jgi:acyl-CoA thioesterase
MSGRICGRLPAPRSSVAAVRRERIERLLAADRYARHLDIHLVEVSEDRLVLEMPLAEHHLNFLDLTHGAAVFSLADVAMSLASNAGGERAVAIDAHLVISGGSAAGDVLRAVAEPAVGGRRLGTHRITVTRGDGRVVGMFTGTVLRTGPSEG